MLTKINGRIPIRPAMSMQCQITIAWPKLWRILLFKLDPTLRLSRRKTRRKFHNFCSPFTFCLKIEITKHRLKALIVNITKYSDNQHQKQAVTKSRINKDNEEVFKHSTSPLCIPSCLQRCCWRTSWIETASSSEIWRYWRPKSKRSTEYQCGANYQCSAVFGAKY